MIKNNNAALHVSSGHADIRAAISALISAGLNASLTVQFLLQGIGKRHGGGGGVLEYRNVVMSYKLFHGEDTVKDLRFPRRWL
jgi:hypothetical protein